MANKAYSSMIYNNSTLEHILFVCACPHSHSSVPLLSACAPTHHCWFMPAFGQAEHCWDRGMSGHFLMQHHKVALIVCPYLHSLPPARIWTCLCLPAYIHALVHLCSFVYICSCLRLLEPVVYIHIVSIQVIGYLAYLCVFTCTCGQ